MNTPNKDNFTELLKADFAEGIINSSLEYDILCVEVKNEIAHDVISSLKEKHGFAFLTSLNAMHFPDLKSKFGMVYHLHNLPQNLVVRVKSFGNNEHPQFKSLCDIFPSANWMERQEYDFFGFHFDGHPNLKRILNMDSLEGWPLRKEYPLEDQTRTDKDDRMFGR
ncbi:MAG: NADH-quinone oxidoreductase subunit C [Bacteroidetes bacterium]|nr:NADH-quinone oxidoreductase subunit C [Bacteroidota bacterium]